MNWDVFTDKSLNGLDWSNVFCAGGAVLACSIPSRAEENGKKMDLQGRKCFLHADSSWEDVAKDNDLEVSSKNGCRRLPTTKPNFFLTRRRDRFSRKAATSTSSSMTSQEARPTKSWSRLSRSFRRTLRHQSCQ